MGSQSFCSCGHCVIIVFPEISGDILIDDTAGLWNEADVLTGDTTDLHSTPTFTTVI